MSEFTPPPWEFEQNMRGDGIPLPGYYIMGSDDSLDAPPVADVARKADARLIAAAPELYSALEGEETLIKQAQAILERHLYPDSSQDADETINELLGLLDGPQQRKAQSNARAALEKAKAKDTDTG